MYTLAHRKKWLGLAITMAVFLVALTLSFLWRNKINPVSAIHHNKSAATTPFPVPFQDLPHTSSAINETHPPHSAPPVSSDPGKIVDEWISQLPAEQRELAAFEVAASEVLLACSTYAAILKDPAYSDIANFCRDEEARVPVFKDLLPRYAGLALRIPLDDPSLSAMTLQQLAMLAGQGPADDAFGRCDAIGMPQSVQQALHDKVVDSFVSTIRRHIKSDKHTRNQ